LYTYGSVCAVLGRTCDGAAATVLSTPTSVTVPVDSTGVARPLTSITSVAANGDATLVAAGGVLVSFGPCVTRSTGLPNTLLGRDWEALTACVAGGSDAAGPFAAQPMVVEGALTGRYVTQVALGDSHAVVVADGLVRSGAVVRVCEPSESHACPCVACKLG
jgi:hypothetical protein